MGVSPRWRPLSAFSARFGRNQRVPAALIAPGATAQPPATAGPQHTRFLGRPSRPRSRSAVRAASVDTARTGPRSYPANPHALGYSWQTVLHLRYSGHVEARQVLNDLRRNAYARP